MNNKIYVSVSMIYSENKNGYGSVKTTIKVSAKKIGSDKMVEVKLKPYKNVDFESFQYLAMKYENLKEKEGIASINFSKVQARLYKGENNYGSYRLLKVFLDEYVIISCFLEPTEITMLDKFMELNAEYSEETKEKIEFEEPII